MNESIRKNLVAHTYIHSNTDNFVDISLYHYDFKRANSVDKEIKGAKERILGYIRNIISQCNAFYTEIGLTKQDYFDENTGLLHPLGAKEFSEKYLGQKDYDSLQDDSNISTIFLTIFDSLSYKKALKDEIDKHIDINKNIDKEQFAKDYNDFFTTKTKEVNLEIENITIETIYDFAENAFYEKKIYTRKKDNAQIHGTRIKESYFKKRNKNIFNGAGELIEEARKNKEGAEKLKKFIINKYVHEIKIEPKELANYMWTALINCDYNNKIKNRIKKEDFISFFKESLKKYQSKEVNINILDNASSYSGFILEEGFTFAIDQDPLINNIIDEIKVVGQKYEHKDYVGSIDKKNNKTVAQSGTDIVIKINEKEYKIQAKNSFAQGEWDSINLQSQIKVDTFAQKVLDQKQAEEFEYLIFNKAYLSRVGLDRYGNTNLYSNQNTLDKYISFFLNETLSYLIAGKIKQLDEPNVNYIGNLFFIFKGRYLIPVSMFLYSAYYLISKIYLSTQDISNMDTIGKLTYSKKLNGVDITLDQAKKYRARKLHVIEDYWDIRHQNDADRDLSYFKKYPDAMVDIGEEIGKRLKQSAFFPSLKFSSISMTQLDKFFK